MYLCQPRRVILPPLTTFNALSHSLLLSHLHRSLPPSTLFPLLFISCFSFIPILPAEKLVCIFLRGTEDGWEDGRQRDGERGRCSFGLVYLINYVLSLPLATLHLIFSLLQTYTHAYKWTRTHLLFRYLFLT